MSKKIIGGVKGLRRDRISSCSQELLSKRNGLYYNARSALYAVTQVSSIQCIWLPSFLCETILYPFQRANLQCKYFAVDGRLQTDFEQIPIQPGDAILLISYFGVPVDDYVYSILKSKGALIIEDLSQSFYVEPKSIADFTILSLRKYFPVPDGGIVISHDEKVLYDWPYAAKEDTSFAHHSLEALAGRTLYDAGFTDSREWFEVFQSAESSMPTGLHPMSNFTQAQMVGVIDFENDRLQRISNFNFLFSELERVSLIKDMKGSAPLGFPIVLERRDEVRSALFKHNIYPPIHWAVQGVVPVQYKESHELSRRVMTIPCDGRYDSFDMRRIVSILENECGV